MDKISTTNKLLLVLIVPLVFYLLKVLSFIFVPLLFSMFIALLFLPFMRWVDKKDVPKWIGPASIIGIIASAFYLAIQLFKLSIRELISADSDFIDLAKTRIIGLLESIESFIGIERDSGDTMINHYFEEFNLYGNLGQIADMVGDTLTMILMTAFFVLLLLAGSKNLQEILQTVIFRRNYASVKAFIKIEQDLIKFIWVKFLISLCTGIGFTLACVFFDVSFPIFWGLFAFLINFIQMVGSVMSIILLSLFSLVELEPSGTLLAFVLVISGVQVLMGGILEPIFLGKTFSINVVTVLVMLMFWGFLWGVPGLIMAIPITVFIKIVLEQFPKTQVIARLMSGSEG